MKGLLLPRLPRSRGSFWVTSLVVHVALAAVILPATLGTARVASWFGLVLTERPTVTEERVRFVAQAEPRPVRTPNGRDRVSGGREAPPAATVVPPDVPATVPSDVPLAPAAAAGSEPTARGDGSGGPLEGIKPNFADPRLWTVPWGPAPVVERPSYEMVRTRIQELVRDGLLNKAYEDSVSKVYGMIAGRSPGDWTMGGPNGERWGIDGGMIRLGKIAIPTALLALLPLNSGQINVQQFENNRRLNQMSADIRFQAQRAMNEDEFRAAVRRVRERREREREEERKRRESEKSVVPVQP